MRNSIILSELDFSEILEPLYVKTYEETLDIIWGELIRLNSYLYILEKILKFSEDTSDLFIEPDKQNFLSLVNISFTENSLLIVTKLTTDTAHDVLSILKFKNLVRTWVKQKYQKYFYQLLRENRFSYTFHELKEKVKNIRDNRIAHLIVDQNLRLKDSPDRISWQEINLITNELNRLFNLLCFNYQHSLLPLDYDPKVQHPVGSDSRSDIEYFLDLIIQDSPLYKMPDESQYWNIEKEGLSPEIISILNRYRRKFGKPEV